MGRLPSDIRPNRMVRALERAGFKVRATTGSHAQLRHPDGRATTVALHAKALKPGMVAKILRDARLTVAELRELL
jgi:predicted RNA binding protein YcfA (HicA-like mRNA interferase family)